MKNETILIFVLIFIAISLYSINFVQATQHEPDVHTNFCLLNTHTPPGTGDWVWFCECKNGAGYWVCKGNCENNPEPPEKEPPTSTTTTTTLPPIGGYGLSIKLDKTWQPVQGYAQGFNKCLSLCNAYVSQKCSQQSALAYCNAMFSVDLNKAGSINANEFGKTPVGRSTCETNVHCFDLIKDCPCTSQSLNLQSCVSLLYTSYTSQYLSIMQSYVEIAQSLVGNCYQNPA